MPGALLGTAAGQHVRALGWRRHRVFLETNISDRLVNCLLTSWTPADSYHFLG